MCYYRILVSLFIKSRFRPGLVKEILHGVLVEFFHEKQYAPEYIDQWTKDLCDLIKSKLKGKYEAVILPRMTLSIVLLVVMCFLIECEFERYKFVVQVVIGEQRGEGVK